jgi:8-oxo-dGTP diphosphatase
VKKIPTVVPVVALALINREGRVLMQRRRLSADHGGLWEFPGGKVEAGETLVSALVREISEELGLVLAPEALEPLAFAAGPDQPHVILLYTCRSWAGDPVCLDGEEIGWFAAEMLTDLAMPPLDVPLAQAVRERIEMAK